MYDAPMYDSFTQCAPMIFVLCMVFIVGGNIHLRVTLHQLRKQRKTIADARIKYARELVELRRAQHVQNM